MLDLGSHLGELSTLVGEKEKENLKGSNHSYLTKKQYTKGLFTIRGRSKNKRSKRGKLITKSEAKNNANEKQMNEQQYNPTWNELCECLYPKNHLKMV